METKGKEVDMAKCWQPCPVPLLVLLRGWWGKGGKAFRGRGHSLSILWQSWGAPFEAQNPSNPGKGLWLRPGHVPAATPNLSGICSMDTKLVLASATPFLLQCPLPAFRVSTELASMYSTPASPLLVS